MLCPTEEHQGQGQAGFWGWGWDWGDVSSCFCLQDFSMWAFALEGTPAPDHCAFPGLGGWVSGVHGHSITPTLQSQAGGDRVLSDLMMGLGFPETRGRRTWAVSHPQQDPESGQEPAGKRSENLAPGLCRLLPGQDVVLSKQPEEESPLWL